MQSLRSVNNSGGKTPEKKHTHMHTHAHTDTHSSYSFSNLGDTNTLTLPRAAWNLGASEHPEARPSGLEGAARLLCNQLSGPPAPQPASL